MMFGESQSESPRLPSPWQQAVASAQVILTPIPPLSTSSGDATKSHGHLSNAGCERGHPLTPSHSASTETLSGTSASHSLSANGTETGSFTSDPSMHARLWSNGLSENLIMSPGPDSDPRSNHGRNGDHGIVMPPKLMAERDKAGHIEYKFKLVAPTQERFERLTTQLKWRLTEGGGEAMYEIGVLDDGTLVGITRPEMEHSLRTLELMAAELGATVMVLRTISLTAPPLPSTSSPSFPNSTPYSNQNLPTQPPAPSTTNSNLPPPQSTLALQKLAKFHKYLNRSPLELEQERKDRLGYAAKKRARHAKRMEGLGSPDGPLGTTMDGSGQVPVAGARRRSGKRSPVWAISVKGVSGAEEMDSKASSERGKVTRGSSEREVGTVEDTEYGKASPETTPKDTTPDQAASWQQRNLERAHLEWNRQDEAVEAILNSGSGSDEAESSLAGMRRRRRKPWREKKVTKDSDQVDRNQARRSRSLRSAGEESDSSEPLGIDNRAEEVEDEVFLFDGLDSSPDGAGQPLTSLAISELDKASGGAQDLVQTYLGSGLDSAGPIRDLPHDYHLPTKKRGKKRFKQTKLDRGEKRRMDLLRGDGVTPDGEFLFGGDEDSKDSIFLQGMGASPDTDADNGVQGVLDRLMGLSMPISGKRDQPAMVPPDSASHAQLSTSPSATVKPSSPSADFPLSLDEAAEAEVYPSPAQTITMPLDTMSLSFSQAHTAVGAGTTSSSDDEDDEDHPSAVLEQPPIHPGDPGMRLCVEAIVIKKMEAEDRFSFFGFDGA